MHETETLKVMQQVEELLRRIASGLNSNVHLVPTELLVLCHTLISQNARFLKEVPKPDVGKKGRKQDAAIVQLKRRVTVDDDHYANNSFRCVATQFIEWYYPHMSPGSSYLVRSSSTLRIVEVGSTSRMRPSYLALSRWSR